MSEETASVEVAEQPQGQESATPEQATPDTQTTGDTQKAEVQSDEPAESDQLLTSEEVSQLKGKELDLYKKAQKAFTQKTMKLAEQRKSLEPYQEFIKSYEANPRDTIQWLAQQHGIEFNKGDSKAETAAKVEEATQTLTEELAKSLGEDYAFLAERIGPVIEKAVKGIAESSLKPIKDAQQQAVLEAAQKKTESILETFGKRHPDWKKHETEMLKIAPKLQVNGLDENEYMEILYTYVTRDTAAATAARDMVDKMKTSAQKSEQTGSGVEPSKIAPQLQGKNFEEKFKSAFELAKQGIVLER